SAFIAQTSFIRIHPWLNCFSWLARLRAQKNEARKDQASMKVKAGLVATATAAAITTAAAAVFTATATTASALFARLGHVDGQSAAVHFPAVQGFNGLVGFLDGAHGDKSKTARTSGFPVHHQVGFSDRAMRGERVIQVVFGGVEGKVSDIQ